MPIYAHALVGNTSPSMELHAWDVPKFYAWAIRSLSLVHVWFLHWQSRMSRAFTLGISYAHAWVGNTGPSMELHAWIMHKSQAWS